MDFTDKSVALIGFGISNKALCDYLIAQGIYPNIRCENECEVPRGTCGIFGKGYLDTYEDIVFRSPSVHPRLLPGGCQTELELALGVTSAFKIGVTGSDGKTTSTTLIYRMLKEGGKNAFIGGNVGSAIISFAPRLGEKDYLCVEMSSFQLYGYTPCLDVALVTNISQNHLDWHENMADYIYAKKNITKKAKRTVLNYDNITVRLFGGEKITYFTTKDASGLLSRDYDFVYISKGDIYYNRERLFSIDKISLKGKFNLENVLASIGVAYPIVGCEPCKRVAYEFCGVENRMEEVGVIEGVTFVSSSIDTTPTRSINTLSAFGLSKTVAIMGGYDKNLSYEMLASCLDGLKGIVVCGENSEKLLEVTKNKRVIKVNTLKEATSVAFGMAQSGDFVVLSPASASYDMFKNYKEKASCFKEAVRGLRNGRN